MTLLESIRVKQEPTVDWMIRVFGSIEAWHRSRTRFRHVLVGQKRKEVLRLRLVSHSATKWRLPCPDKPTPPEIKRAVARMVTGVGPRTRLAYMLDGEHRIAVGRHGEPADNLRLELVATYGLVWNMEVRPENDALAEYVATGGNYRPFARQLRIGDQMFLAKAMNPVEVERSVLLSDRQLDRVWRLQPKYEAEEGMVDDPGEWATGTLEEITIGDRGGEAEPPVPLPMAIPKADGRGRHNLYFGHALYYGCGRRWLEADFFTPLKIMLGGELNCEQGFGGSTHANEVLPYKGDGFHWGRKNPLAVRIVDHDKGPVFRTVSALPPADGLGDLDQFADERQDRG